MLLDNYKNTAIFKETDVVFQKSWFDIKAKKVVHNIDTLYLTADIKGDYNELNKDLISWLKFYEDQLDFEDIYISDLDMFYTKLYFQQYKYAIEKKDHFVIYFANKKSTVNTPPIFIQLRSQGLWLLNEYELLKVLHINLSNLLGKFNLEVAEYKENRIDYAYHTNYIKNMNSYFDLNDLNSMQVSKLSDAQPYLKLIGDNETRLEYIGFGRRTSNNIFIRMYDKRNEVVEQGYKQFFLKFWHEQGMINNYDLYIYEKCFLDRSLRNINRHRIDWYIEYSPNQENVRFLKNEFKDYKSKEYDYIRDFAEKLTPEPTLIINVEFQTKRKFYSTFSSDMLKILDAITESPCDALNNIYKLLDNKILIHNLLTHDVFRMVDPKDNRSRKRDKECTPFWRLIQGCSMGYKTNQKMLRQYQRNLDIDYVKTRLMYAVSSFSLMVQGENEKGFIEDNLSLMSYVNENDIQRAKDYKRKKAPLLRSRLESTDNVEIGSRYALIDREDGTYIE